MTSDTLVETFYKAYQNGEILFISMGLVYTLAGNLISLSFEQLQALCMCEHSSVFN